MSPQLICLALFNASYLLAGALVAWWQGSDEFVFYSVILLLLIAFVALVHRRVGLHLASLWLLSIWGAVHMAGGLWPIGEERVLYDLWLLPDLLRYDHLVHAYGFGTTTWVCWQVLRRHLVDDGPRLGPVVMAVAAGMGFGAANELVEFVATISLPETNVGGYENTGWDLVANAVGTMLVGLAILLVGRRGEREDIVDGR